MLEYPWAGGSWSLRNAHLNSPVLQYRTKSQDQDRAGIEHEAGAGNQTWDK